MKNILLIIVAVVLLSCSINNSKYDEVTYRYSEPDSAKLNIEYMTDTFNNVIRHYPVRVKALLEDDSTKHEGIISAVECYTGDPYNSTMIVWEIK